MKSLDISAQELISAILGISASEQVCLLDSCGIKHLGSHLLIAGLRPLETIFLSDTDPDETLKVFNQKLSNPKTASFFTISYNFGLKLEGIRPRKKDFKSFEEPDIFLASFECLIIHNYDTAKTYLTGNAEYFKEIEDILSKNIAPPNLFESGVGSFSVTSSNFTRQGYVSAIKEIQELIRRGDTYQTNLTQQFRATLPAGLSPQKIFSRLRESHPAPFSAFFKRGKDAVVSISPERFFKVTGRRPFIGEGQSRIITASPIKGTRPRGKTTEKDRQLKNDLITSEKDRAENIMIVDLLRNDIGRICRYGSVRVETLCELEEHPTLFHLVSTIRGHLREGVNYADMLRAVFPCGSITGAPKIRTMQIIDEIETADRGLSMGAIGFCATGQDFQIPGTILDLSVAIRTLVICENEAIFNVGGGIVIDSEPELEFEESLLKAGALLKALNSDFGL